MSKSRWLLAAAAALAVPAVAVAARKEDELLTLEQLQAIMPNAGARAREYLPLLVAGMKERGITTRARKATYLANLGHESGSFRYMEEIASGEAYEGRRDLGNVKPGDGRRFKGRGPIQLTGRSNYRAAGRALGVDLENNPARAAEPSIGFRTAAWYFESHGCNELADKGNWLGVVRAINGGTNGLEDRERYYERALRALPPAEVAS